MCKWGKHTGLVVCGRVRDIDSCIYPLVAALNKEGFTTVACCCGHGQRPGTIALADGRELLILPDFRTARKVDALLETAGMADPINPSRDRDCHSGVKHL